MEKPCSGVLSKFQDYAILWMGWALAIGHGALVLGTVNGLASIGMLF